MASSWITCARPAAVPAKGYDEEAGRPGVVWRLQVAIGATKDIDIVGLAQALAVDLRSNNPNVVANGAFNLRRSGDRWTASITGKQIGTTLINLGFTPPPGGSPLSQDMGPMPITPDWGPIVLQVQVTRADGTMPGSDLGIPPEGQIDAMACWAACLAWWTRAVPEATARRQIDLIGAATGATLANGSLSLELILRFFASQSILRAERIQPNKLAPYVAARRFPMIIGFSSGPLGGHVNVIHGYDEARGTVTVMEPWFPDPSNDPAYEFDTSGGLPVFSAKKDGTPFRFTGKHLVRPLTYYTSRPMNGAFVVAYASTGPGIITN